MQALVQELMGGNARSCLRRSLRDEIAYPQIVFIGRQKLNLMSATLNYRLFCRLWRLLRAYLIKVYVMSFET